MKGKQLWPFKSIIQINPLVSSHYLFVGKMLLLFKICLLHILKFTLEDFIMEASTMNSDQTAPKEQSDLGPYCLTYRLPKYIN